MAVRAPAFVGELVQFAYILKDGYYYLPIIAAGLVLAGLLVRLAVWWTTALGRRRELDASLLKRVESVETKRVFRAPRSEVSHLFRDCKALASSATVNSQETCQMCLKQHRDMLEAMIEGRVIDKAA